MLLSCVTIIQETLHSEMIQHKISEMLHNAYLKQLQNAMKEKWINYGKKKKRGHHFTFLKFASSLWIVKQLKNSTQPNPKAS